MDNKENNIQDEQKENCNCKKCCCTIALMTFLGSFLAFYFLMHQSMIHFFKHHHKHGMPRYEQSFENDFRHDLKKMENYSEKEVHMLKNNLSSVQTSKYEDAYVIVINLKPFNNNPDNIKFNLNGNTVTINGTVVKNKKNGENTYYFAESYEIPDKIDAEKITKEKIHDKYIITIPIDD